MECTLALTQQKKTLLSKVTDIPMTIHSKSPVQERLEFSSRLQQALENAGYAPDSPTQLAREFNLRHTQQPVTPHAARKWLIGEAMPTQNKLRVLADWLGVSVYWLRFDTDKEAQAEKTGQTRLSRMEASIVNNLRYLDSEQQQMIVKLVQSLAKPHLPAAPAQNNRARGK